MLFSRIQKHTFSYRAIRIMWFSFVLRGNFPNFPIFPFLVRMKNRAGSLARSIFLASNFDSSWYSRNQIQRICHYKLYRMFSFFICNAKKETKTVIYNSAQKLIKIAWGHIIAYKHRKMKSSSVFLLKREAFLSADKNVGVKKKRRFFSIWSFGIWNKTETHKRHANEFPRKLTV